jgi:integrative and conjugative element protein (TIGR02256 family)
VPDLAFRSEDHRYGLHLPHACVTDIVGLCTRAGNRETGGVLIGYYTERLDVAAVTTATEPPPDSSSGTTWFKRGVHGLKARLEEYWQDDHFYLGEWHFHPQDMPGPSPTDRSRMERIATSTQYECPSPVLLIIGGSMSGEWLLGAYVFPVGEPMVRLLPCK